MVKIIIFYIMYFFTTLKIILKKNTYGAYKNGMTWYLDLAFFPEVGAREIFPINFDKIRYFIDKQWKWYLHQAFIMKI